MKIGDKVIATKSISDQIEGVCHRHFASPGDVLIVREISKRPGEIGVSKHREMTQMFYIEEGEYEVAAIDAQIAARKE